MLIVCAYRLCRAVSDKPTGAVHRSRLAGLNLYCNRVCSGLGRRDENPKTKEQRVAAKADYDRQRRHALRDELRAKKAAYHKRTYDPVKAAKQRKLNMPRHVEYCRRSAYRAKKRDYDKQYRAQRDFGAYAEAAMLLVDLEGEVLSRMSRYEIGLANGTINKRLKRKREHEQSQAGRI